MPEITVVAKSGRDESKPTASAALAARLEEMGKVVRFATYASRLELQGFLPAHELATLDQKTTVGEFLEQVRPGGPWVLTAISPVSEAIETVTVRTTDEADAFIRRHNGKRNLYYSVNPTRQAMHSKAAKIDIAAIEYIPADLDPADGESADDAKARYLAALGDDGSAVVDSGNGVQVLWKLDTPIVLGAPIQNGKGELEFSSADQAKIDDVEARTKARMEALGATAGTQNIDRVLRLPGTTNLPNKVKRKAGRVPVPTKLLRFNGATFPLTAFSRNKGEQFKTLADEQSSKRDPSGSGHGFRFMQARHADGMSYEDACEAILADKTEAGEWANRVDERQLKRAWERSKPEESTDAYVDRLNERHAIVRVGVKTAILDEQPGQPPQFMRVEDFHLWHANDEVQVGKLKTTVSRLWIKHPLRRQYQRVVFDPQDNNPDHFNMWRGFSVKPDPNKSCAKFLAHIRDNICTGDQDHYMWVLGFLAHMVQRPWEKPGVALVLRGKEGVGKGFLAHWIGRLSPQHYVAVSKSVHLTGRFNSHLQQALLVFVDEAFWAGDKQGQGALYPLVTDAELLVEPKFLPPFMVKSLMRFIIASNEKWVVPAGVNARRWCVLDVSDSKMNDRAYFSAIDAEMKNGGLDALMQTLMTFDLSTVDVFTAPKTAALLEQKIESLPPHERWWFECLQEGRIENPDDNVFTKGQGWPAEIEKPRIWQSYALWADRHNIRSRLWPSAQLHKWLDPLMPDSTEQRPRKKGEREKDKRERIVILPSLEECRSAYAARIGQPVDWPEDEAPPICP
jgi:hypothetical protein